MTPQFAFLAGEYFGLSLQAATQRAGIWADGVPESNRRELHLHLRNLLEKTVGQYVKPVHEATHIKNLERIAESLTRRQSGLLVDHHFRIGPTQKALNLYLKYMWCAGHIAMPPHCPVDAVVLRSLKLSPPISWTKMYSIQQYTEVIGALKVVAAPSPLAEWELGEWVRRDA